MRARPPRLAVAALLAAALVLTVGAAPAGAHAGLKASDPAAGSAFDVAPTTIRLTFLEAPEPSLSSIRVTNAAGTSYVGGHPAPVPGDPLTLAVPVQLPDRQVYTVTWRAVSAVDGHSAGGVFSFGVGVPVGALPPPTRASADLKVAPLEVAGRWAFVAGLIAVLGAAAAVLLGFGGSAAMAWTGVGAAAAGLAVLAEAQRRAGATTFGDLLGTGVGRALIWRGLAVGVAAAGLWLFGRRRARLAAWVSGLAAAGAFAAHVSAGHASTPGRLRAASVAAQWLHVLAVGVWAGGLAALLLSVRGGGRGVLDKVRRFSKLALPTIVVLIVTGVARAVGGIPSWGDLWSTGYGRAVTVKSLLVLAILPLAYLNRRQAGAAGAAAIRLLRRLAGGELALAAGALGAAALLASLPPPSVLEGVAPVGLTAKGADAATTVRVDLTTAFALPGPNQFTVKLTDFDTGRVFTADRVSLEFAPLDDPDVAPTTLALDPVNGAYSGRGSNMNLEGRWGITVQVQRGTQSVTVPLQLQTKSPPQYLTVLAPPGAPKEYTLELVSSGGFLRVWADPTRGGASHVFATFFDRFGDPQPVGDPILVVGAGSAARQETVRRLDTNRFVADVTLPAGMVPVAVVARTSDGDLRVRGAFTLPVPKR